MYIRGLAAFDSLSRRWEQLGIEEPEELETMMRQEAAAKREELEQFLTAKTKPDLGHVKVLPPFPRA